MKTNIKMRVAVIILLSLPVIAYSGYQARFLLSGPRIWIDNPQNGQSVMEPLVTVEGRAKNVAWISINDRQIFTDEHGQWSEKLLVAQGISIITIMARDRLGREKNQTLQIFLN